MSKSKKKKARAPKAKPEKLVKCYLCELTCAKVEDDFCHGCKQHVCEKCCTNGDVAWGGHAPEDHRAADEGEDDEGAW
jgi:hypothetical protein